MQRTDHENTQLYESDGLPRCQPKSHQVAYDHKKGAFCLCAARGTKFPGSFIAWIHPKQAAETLEVRLTVLLQWRAKTDFDMGYIHLHQEDAPSAHDDDLPFE